MSEKSHSCADGKGSWHLVGSVWLTYTFGLFGVSPCMLGLFGLSSCMLSSCRHEALDVEAPQSEMLPHTSAHDRRELSLVSSGNSK